MPKHLPGAPLKHIRFKPGSTVEVENKYGKIHVVPWSKDSVKFDIEYQLTAGSRDKLEKLKSSINFDYTVTAFYVGVKTVFGYNSKSIFSGLIDMAEYLLESDNISVNYKVYVPANVTLGLNQKFGDIYIDDFSGTLNIDLSNGDIKANSLTGKTNIKIASGGGVIYNLENGSADISYSNFTVRNGGKVNFVSRSSKLIFEDVQYLKGDSRRDKITVEKLNQMYGESYFSDLTVEELSNEFDYNLKYGNLNIEKLQKGFNFINISSEYTDIQMLYDRQAAFEIDVTHSPDVYLQIPNHLANLQQKTVGEAGTGLITYGTVGGSNPSSKIKISALKKCNIEINYR
ncbi:MAG: hypothetical protein HC896_12400 [Bacteroidales bacterium]|nr:hypothetical protein [Bacteroidales bacterium]